MRGQQQQKEVMDSSPPLSLVLLRSASAGIDTVTHNKTSDSKLRRSLWILRGLCVADILELAEKQVFTNTKVVVSYGEHVRFCTAAFAMQRRGLKY